MTDSPETPPTSTTRPSTPLFLSGQSSVPGPAAGDAPAAPQPSTSGPAADGVSLPRMGAEIGYQVVSDDDVPPFRASGVVCLVLGLLSFWATVAWQMLILPIVAIVFGVIALRRWSGRRPAGTTVAVIGLLLAVGFGAAGITIPLAKRATLGEQATYFARQFLEVVGNGDVELAMELRKEARNRQVKEMNLEEAYREDEIARESLEESTQDGIIETIHLAGPDIPWELAEPVRVYVKYNMERVDTYWIDPSGKVEGKVQVELQWTPNEKSGVGNWHVNLFQFHRELIVAPSVL